MVYFNVYIPFSDMDPVPEPSSYGSGSGKSDGPLRILIYNTGYSRGALTLKIVLKMTVTRSALASTYIVSSSLSMYKKISYRHLHAIYKILRRYCA
jgi:hypothetical protein